MAELKHVLPRLVTAYEQGTLVPFMGAGMSSGACPMWDKFVHNLEHIASQYTGCPAAMSGKEASAADKIRRANTAVRTLKNSAPDTFPQYVRRALQTIEKEDAASESASPKTTPAQTTILAKLWWPLLMTTNYDDWFYHAYTSHKAEASNGDKRPLEVVGRSPQDCQKVLYSLEASRDSILWALQGFVGGQHPEGQKFAPDTYPWEKRLEEELVVGHQEYRRVTNNSLHFRRAFAEVFRNRSLWFVGTGLSEDYFLNLFGEILETYGPNLVPHYAFVKRGEVDADFMQERFGMIIVEFDDYSDINKALANFEQQVNSAHTRVMQWDFSLACTNEYGETKDCIHLQIVRGKLPTLSASEANAEAIALSAGGGINRLWPSTLMRGYITEMADLTLPGRHVEGEHLEADASAKFVRHLKDAPLFLVVARAPTRFRDARTIAPAVEELMNQALKRNYTRVHCQLLSAGRSSDTPPYISLIEMVRGYAAWFRKQNGSSGKLPTLAIHLVAPDVLFDVATRRINVLELLTAQDTRFWVQVVRDVEEPERFLMQMPGETLVRDLLTRFSIPSEGWFADVIPAPIRYPESLLTGDIADDDTCTLDALGVFPGSVLSFSRASRKVTEERFVTRHGIRR